MTEPLSAVIAGALVGIIKDIVKDIVKDAGNKLYQQKVDERQVLAALMQYKDKYRLRYGQVKWFGMTKPVELEKIYTKILLTEPNYFQFLDRETLEQIHQGEQPHWEEQELHHETRQRKLDAVTVINEHPYLMVLGKPGSGKSTFLRRTGLEAFKGKYGLLTYPCIPVMLELKQFNSDEINLEKAVADELSNFGFPSEAFATKALDRGELLILLDGLDEVPKTNIDEVLKKVQAFVNKYSQNRYIASCRTAAYHNATYRSSFQQFTDVELAEFENDQIQNFISNWFTSKSDQGSNTAENFQQNLNEPSNAAAKQLARTPLLLTLLCIIYDCSGRSFPSDRTSIYEKVLDILLKEWAEAKLIHQEPIYEELTPNFEKQLLSEIAYNGFINDQRYFTQQELVDRIEESLSKKFPSNDAGQHKPLDGKAVLNAIAIQQGILVKPTEDTYYSFSHLTLQAYLIAQYINQAPDLMRVELVRNRLVAPRWRESFLLIASSSQSANKLREFMEAVAQDCISSPKLRALLEWINEATYDSDSDYPALAKRVAAIYLTLALDCDRILARDLDLAHTRARTLALDLACALKFDQAHVRIHALAFDFAGRFNYDLALSLAYAHAFEESKIFNSIDFSSLIANLKQLQFRASDSDKSPEARRVFVEQIRQIWLNALHLQQEWVELSEQELQELTNYLYVNELMVRCKQAAARASAQAWQGIEERMLTIQN